MWQYLRQHPDDDISDTLTVLSDVQRFLRAKQPQRALNCLQRLQDPPPLGGVPLDVTRLEQQLHILKDTAELLEQRRIDTAVDSLQAVDLPLLQAERETQRGTAYIFRNDLELAQESFARAIAQDPKHYRAITNQGNVALETGNVDEAIAAYEQALRINEDFANAHHNLGVAYRRKGEYGKSVAAIKRAQRAMRAQDSQEARSSLSSLGRSGGSKMLKWLIYGAVGYGVYLFLQAQGIL